MIDNEHEQKMAIALENHELAYRRLVTARRSVLTAEVTRDEQPRRWKACTAELQAAYEAFQTSYEGVIHCYRNGDR